MYYAFNIASSHNNQFYFCCDFENKVLLEVFAHLFHVFLTLLSRINRLGKFSSISGRQTTAKIQNLVVHNYLWSSSSVFLLQNSRQKGKIGIFVIIISQKSSCHEDDQNST